MTVSSDEFKSALRLFASGVTIVTIQTADARHGLTVSAFVSISVEPPLIGIMIDRGHHAHQILESDGAVFAVNILAQGQEALSNRFAWKQDEDRFSEGLWTTAATGAPVLEDALCWLDCTIHSKMEAGTHTIYVGEVQACQEPSPEEQPLVYWNREYRQIRHRS